jgi:hypothetical protein
MPRCSPSTKTETKTGGRLVASRHTSPVSRRKYFDSADYMIARYTGAPTAPLLSMALPYDRARKTPAA